MYEHLLPEHMPSGDVDSDINPYTGEPIPQVDASEWYNETNTTKLYNNLSILENRLLIARTLGKVEYINPLMQAIEELRERINHIHIVNRNKPIRKRPNAYANRRQESDPNGIPGPEDFL